MMENPKVVFLNCKLTKSFVLGEDKLSLTLMQGTDSIQFQREPAFFEGIMALVSVVLTTKNEGKNIANCLDSVLRQTKQNLEIIVVDNNSTDETKKIARHYTEKVFNLGPERSSQRNFGVSQATGKYILYLDADMILEPGVVEECTAICEADPAVSGIYVPERIIGHGFWIKVRSFERSFYDGTVIDAVRFVPKSQFEATGGFDEALWGAEDWDFDKKIRGSGKVVVCKSELMHNEGDFNLGVYLNKKSYYAGSFDKYVARWGASDPDVQRQLGPWYRYLQVFVEDGKYRHLLRHPILTLAMYYLRFRVGLRYLRVKRQNA
jgi:glycosyltransferase involved in cell wall biosynthesis